MTSPLCIGLDYGSDSARAVVVDCHSGEELACAVAPYRRWQEGAYCDPSRQQFRQSPHDYVEALQQSVQAVLAEIPDRNALVGIGVDTTGSSPLPLDARGTPLAYDPRFADDPDAQCILWKDHTAVAEAEELTALAHGGDYPDITRWIGGIYSSEWWWAKICHIMRTNAAVAEAAVSWVEHCDWIPALLSDTCNPASMARSRCAAGHKACWHPDWGGLPPAAMLEAWQPGLARIRQHYNTTTHTVDQAVGGLCQAWAQRLGLPQGIRIAGGAFDAHLGAIGAGASPFTLVKVMGTSTCDMLCAPPAAVGERSIPGICGQVDGSILPGMLGIEAGQSAFGDIFAWFARLLSFARSEQDQADLLHQLEAAAQAVAPGSQGVTSLDWFNGRRTPDANQRLQAAIAGLHLGHDTATIYRSLLEGAAMGARAIVERLVTHGIPVEQVLAIGGIAHKSPLTMQICADVLQRPIGVVQSDQCCARGSAIAAAVAAGIYPDMHQAIKHMASPLAQFHQPDTNRAALYDQVYARYQGLGAFMEQQV